MATLATKLPNLEIIKWDLGPEEPLFLERRKQQRDDLGEALFDTCKSCPNLRCFRLTLSHRLPSDHSFAPPALSSSDDDDRLTLSLRHILALPSLHTFTISTHSVLSPTIFTPL